MLSVGYGNCHSGDLRLVEDLTGKQIKIPNDPILRCFIQFSGRG